MGYRSPKKQPYLINMFKLVTTILLVLLAPQLSANHKLLTSIGNYKFSGKSYEVEISIAEVSKNHIKPHITYFEQNSKYGAGYGNKEGLPVIPKKWGIQFQPPNNLWVYDGSDLIILYKRTASGISAYDNTVIKDLINSAPDELKALMLVNPSK